jgi:uncharacterized protein YigE (DUF2233 family)
VKPFTIQAPGAAPAASAANAAPQVQTYQLTVGLQAGTGQVRYRTTAVVVSFSPSYKAQIAYVGGKRGKSGTYNDLPELMAANKAGLVMNGGFYTTDPATPAGLLLVDGQIISPLGFSSSATLCVDRGGRMKILRTEELRPVARSIASICNDGLQAFPIAVAKGTNAIRPAELGRKPFLRTILGFRRDGSPVAVFFRSPVHLYAAAEFLRAAPVKGNTVQVSGVVGRNVHASGGLGLVEAVNLSGDTDSFAALNGRVLLGDAYRELPSAIVIR